MVSRSSSPRPSRRPCTLRPGRPAARLVARAPMLDALLAMQAGSGAFPSTVDVGDRLVSDETCFVTAQVALILFDVVERRMMRAPSVIRARERALDFIEQCAAPGGAGAFQFYPPGTRGA